MYGGQYKLSIDFAEIETLRAQIEATEIQLNHKVAAMRDVNRAENYANDYYVIGENTLRERIAKNQLSQNGSGVRKEISLAVGFSSRGTRTRSIRDDRSRQKLRCDPI